MGTKSPKNTARMLALFERGLARKMPLLGLAGLLEYLADVQRAIRLTSGKRHCPSHLLLRLDASRALFKCA
jgi:hypothetical protein